MTRRGRTNAYDRNRWMVSYLDVITILLIFFLTAAAQGWKSSVPLLQPSKASSIAQTPRPPSAPPPRAEVKAANQKDEESVRESEEAELAGIARELKLEGFDVQGSTEERGGLTILLPQALLFSSGDDRISPAARGPLEKIANALRHIPNKVNLAGHADAAPIHNDRFHNNWELAASRSLQIMEALTQDYGISEERVTISSYGPLQPKGPNDTADGRASNRRVEIMILSERTR